MKRTSELGLSLFELLVTLSILSIFATFAAPVVSSWLERARQDALSNTLLRHLHAARVLSIERGHTVALCPIDESGCGDDWTRGWQLRDIEADEVLLRHVDLPGGVKIRWNRTTHIAYRHNGTSAGLNGTISLCDARGNEVHRIVISNHGRTRLAKGRGGPLCLVQAEH